MINLHIWRASREEGGVCPRGSHALKKMKRKLSIMVYTKIQKKNTCCAVSVLKQEKVFHNIYYHFYYS